MSVQYTSEYGDLSVVVFVPGAHGNQRGFQFHDEAPKDGLSDISRRTLAIIRALLQDALTDVDDELAYRGETK